MTDSYDDINQLIEQKNQEINDLKEKIRQRKQAEEARFNKLQGLLVSLSDCESQYYSYRTILGDPLIEISDFERDTVESLMSLYEQKIAGLRKELQDFKIGEL